MIESKTVTSPKTNLVFNIKSEISCLTENVIYLIYDKICTYIFYVDHTGDDMRTRWRNHKSHIKKGHKSCEISSHFINNSRTVHNLNKSNQTIFTSELSKQLSVMLIECVDPIPGKTMKQACEARETYWQGALKASSLYGGINKRNNR